MRRTMKPPVRRATQPLRGPALTGPTVVPVSRARTAAWLERTRRRQGAVFVVLVLALVGLLGRLAYWQIGLSGPLGARAGAEHLRTLAIPAGRGRILDTHGAILALSILEDAVIADPDVIRQTGMLDQTVSQLAGPLHLPVAALRQQLNVPGAYVALRGADGQPLLLDLAASDAVQAAIDSGQLPGVRLSPVARRSYPNGSLASQVLGFVRTSDGAGQYGVELGENGALAGTPGQLTTMVDAQGEPLATGPQQWQPPRPGEDVTLTLDANIQAMAEQGLAGAVAQTGADGGTVIVLDPHTGAVLALANWPDFDPNAYATAPLSRFTDPGVSAVYDPGSVMKAMTMAAGIDTGVITPDTAFYDPGYAEVGGVTLHNWESIAWGRETMTLVLEHSANVGAIWVEQRIGATRFQEYLARFGYGARTGVGLPSEAAGAVPQPSDPNAAALTAAEQAFGESIAATPLQVAAAYGALASGGVLMQPYIVQCVTQVGVASDGASQGASQGARTCTRPREVRRVVSAATARTVTAMLAASDQHSDALMYLIGDYSIAAKTGTSTPDPSHPNWTYASVVGYAPASNPRFVLLVKLDHPRTTIFGGFAAGPLWRSLAQQLFVYLGIPPDQPGG